MAPAPVFPYRGAMLSLPVPTWLAMALGAAHLAGVVSAAAALMGPRTPQGSVAWILSLLLVPWVAVPLYWSFGRIRFEGYVTARRGRDDTLRRVIADQAPALELHRRATRRPHGRLAAMERMARIPVLEGNRTTILRDGEATFASLFAGIERARKVILVQFYIVRDDALGVRFREALEAAARRGVRVYFLVDRVGSVGLPDRYLRALEDAGVHTARFSGLARRPARLQVNFRNHRKVMVVDGVEGWLGGFNVGDEYLDSDAEGSNRTPAGSDAEGSNRTPAGSDAEGSASGKHRWRDTHLHVEGPAVQPLQLSFLEDWYWARGEVLELDWTPRRPPEGGTAPVLVVPTGPADPADTGSLLMQHAIHSARARVWISSPYFVPDRSLQDAMRLAVLRGVDVRILIPQKGDVAIVDWAGFAFHGDLLRAGVKIFRYRKGILHAKTLVVDDAAAAVGTMNLDNRSLRLNFEITAILLSADSVATLARHFEEDFAASAPLSLEQVEGRPFLARMASQIVYLFAPLL